MSSAGWWLGASLGCAIGAVVAADRIELPPLVSVPGPSSLCEMVDHGPHPERAREVAAARARAAIEAYVAQATSIPTTRAAGVATALRRGVDDPCRLGISTEVRLYFDALERPPRLPVYRSSLAAREAVALQQPITLAIPGIAAAYRSEDATLDVGLDLHVTRDPERRIGEHEALGAELTVTLRDVRGNTDVAVLHHTLTLPDDAAPPPPGPWPAGAIGQAPDWEDGSQPYTWMTSELIDAAAALAIADLGL